MTMQELMERVGDTRFNLIKALAKDGIADIQQITKDNVDKLTTPIVLGQHRYSIADDFIRINEIKVLDIPTGKYHPIPRIYETNHIEDK
jgi:hypothetical protein